MFGMNDAYAIRFSRQAQKDEERLAIGGLSRKARAIVELLKNNPFQNPPPYEKLSGDLTGHYSRRINRQHRLVYVVDTNRRLVSIIRMWTHYE